MFNLMLQHVVILSDRLRKHFGASAWVLIIETTPLQLTCILVAKAVGNSRIALLPQVIV